MKRFFDNAVECRVFCGIIKGVGKEKTIDVLAGRSVTGAIDQHASSLLRSMGVKSLKDLPNLDLTLTQTGDLKADTGGSFVPISIKDAAVYWGNELKQSEQVVDKMLNL